MAGIQIVRENVELERVDDVTIEVFRVRGKGATSYQALLRIGDEVAILHDHYFWRLLRKVARTILAWRVE